jgi:hypothetical protein
VKYLRTSEIQSLPWAGVAEADNVDKAWTFIPSVPIDLTTINKPFGSITREPTKEYRRGQIASATFVAGCPRNNFRLEGSFALLQRYRDDTVTGNDTSRPSKRDVSDDLPQERLIQQTERPSPSMDEIQPATDSATEKVELIDISTPGAVLRNIDHTESPGWITVLDDSDWDLVFRWERVGFLSNGLTGGQSAATLQWEIGEDAEPGKYRFVYNGDAKDLTGKITEFQGISSSFHVVL